MAHWSQYNDSIWYIRNAVCASFDIGGAVCRSGHNPVSGAWPASNLAIYIPVFVGMPSIVKQLFCINGSAVSGNVDVGLYNTDGTRLTSSGSTAQSGTSTIQAFNVTDIQIAVGTYYLAIALDNTTGTIESSTISNASVGRFAGLAEQTSAFALPATATLASYGRLIIPGVGMTLSATV